MQNSLQDILAQKKQKLTAELPQWNNKKKEWIEKVNILFELIHSWLKPFEKDDYLKITYIDISIAEELLGRYSTKKMSITFFNYEKIELVPVGLHIIGAKGRVDMKIGIRKIMIVGNIENSEWMFTEREGRGKPRTWEFNEDNFKEILTEFAEEF